MGGCTCAMGQVDSLLIQPLKGRYGDHEQRGDAVLLCNEVLACGHGWLIIRVGTTAVRDLCLSCGDLWQLGKVQKGCRIRMGVRIWLES